MKVIHIASGQTGTIPDDKFDPQLFKKIPDVQSSPIPPPQVQQAPQGSQGQDNAFTHGPLGFLANSLPFLGQVGGAGIGGGLGGLLGIETGPGAIATGMAGAGAGGAAGGAGGEYI